jgi:hypothetical protein
MPLSTATEATRTATVCSIVILSLSLVEDEAGMGSKETFPAVIHKCLAITTLSGVLGQTPTPNKFSTGIDASLSTKFRSSLASPVMTSEKRPGKVETGNMVCLPIFELLNLEP